jgi:hypothetical protein
MSGTIQSQKYVKSSNKYDKWEQQPQGETGKVFKMSGGWPVGYSNGSRCKYFKDLEISASSVVILSYYSG